MWAWVNFVERKSISVGVEKFLKAWENFYRSYEMIKVFQDFSRAWENSCEREKMFIWAS